MHDFKYGNRASFNRMYSVIFTIILATLGILAYINKRIASLFCG